MRVSVYTILTIMSTIRPIPVAAWSKACVCGRSLAGTGGFESCQGYGCLSLVSVVCCQVEVSATGWSLVQRSSTDNGVSECDRETSIMRRPWPSTGCSSINNSTIQVLRTFPKFEIECRGTVMTFSFWIPKVAGSIQGPKTDYPQIFSAFLGPPLQMLSSTLDHP